MYQGMGEALSAVMKMVMILLIVFIPLGLWKLIEIFIWVYNNVSLSVTLN